MDVITWTNPIFLRCRLVGFVTKLNNQFVAPGREYDRANYENLTDRSLKCRLNDDYEIWIVAQCER